MQAVKIIPASWSMQPFRQICFLIDPAEPTPSPEVLGTADLPEVLGNNVNRRKRQPRNPGRQIDTV